MVTCESCQKSLEPEKILKHIGNRKPCKAHYGPRLLELKRRKEAKRKQRSYKKLTFKERQNIGRKEREKKKVISQRNKQQNMDLASKGVNCKGIPKKDVLEAILENDDIG